MPCGIVASVSPATAERAMKYITPRPFADPAVAARKLLEIANATEGLQDGHGADLFA